MIYNQGDILLINFPFTSGEEHKKRPCMVISRNEYNKERQEIIAVPITSQVEKELFIGDYLINEWKKAGLLKPGIIKCIIFTLEDINIIKKIGYLTEKDLSLAMRSILYVLIGNN